MIPVTHTIKFLVILAALSVTLAGCSTPRPLIRSDFDRTVDFKRYHSFGFFEKLATDDERYESLTTLYLKAAVTREMRNRGYTFIEKDPDLLVNFNIKLEEKQEIQTTSYPIGYYGYYGYRWGYYGAWGGYNYNTYAYEYSEGTLNIDLVDRLRKQMVWEGVAIGRVRQKDFEDVEKAVDNAVNLIFQNFPFKGSPEPAKPH
ncbi:MAG: DUF4136 domain-containing protein [Methylococcaceae bacterium]|nr:DUF4136 domain-containing protein [Methylococcaceae bacterium]